MIAKLCGAWNGPSRGLLFVFPGFAFVLVTTFVYTELFGWALALCLVAIAYSVGWNQGAMHGIETNHRMWIEGQLRHMEECADDYLSLAPDHPDRKGFEDAYSLARKELERLS